MKTKKERARVKTMSTRQNPRLSRARSTFSVVEVPGSAKACGGVRGNGDVGGLVILVVVVVAIDAVGGLGCVGS